MASPFKGAHARAVEIFPEKERGWRAIDWGEGKGGMRREGRGERSYATSASYMQQNPSMIPEIRAV